MPARVIVLAGPSGAGKSHLAERLGLPVVRLDDFYKDADAPGLPCVDIAGGAPIVDWDDPASWDADAAITAIEELCTTGSTLLPSYDIALSRRVGSHRVDLADARLFVAEGIFAQEIVAACRDRGLLASAFCVTQPAALTFVRRLSRDLAEHRKPPLVLLRRGLHLMLRQRSIVADAVAKGCEALSSAEAERRIRGTARIRA